MLARRGVLLLGGSIVLGGVGCKRTPALPASCEDTSGLTEEERGARAALAYADRAASADKPCRSCQHWVAPPDDGKCGGCKLLKGPVHPLGGCKAFAPKA